MKELDRIKSKLDATIKFIVMMDDGLIAEFSYIDRRDGKISVCVPTQTGCNLGCKFCYLSDCRVKVRNLTAGEIAGGVALVLRESEITENILLVSFMGCGEPLLNIPAVIGAAKLLRIAYRSDFKVVRFGLASLIPKNSRPFEFDDQVRKAGLQFKFHLSLHSPFECVRKKLMPAAGSIDEGFEFARCVKHMSETGNTSEIHYALMAGINDRDEDLEMLLRLQRFDPVPIKLLAYNEKPGSPLKRSQMERVKLFSQVLGAGGCSTEFYSPPGSDIGSSCGQFLLEYYKRYNV